MPANVMTIVTWILRLLVAAAFLGAAYLKLSGTQMMIDEFAQIGLGDWFRYFTGLCELVGALALLYPGTTPWGALLLLCVMVGAFITDAFVLHHPIVPSLVLGALLLVILYLTREPVMKMVGGKT